jgi:hypothetical protein
MVFIIILVLLLVLLFIGGLYHLALAVWELRRGENRTEFVRRAIVGGLLLVLAFIAPWLMFIVAGMATGIQAPVIHSVG